MSLPARPTPLIDTVIYERFISKIRFPENLTEGCWEWTASTNIKGYGTFHIKGHSAGFRAHRVAYRLWAGETDEGATLDHLCRNRACVSPFHLEPVSALVNNHRGNIYRADRFERCANGHSYIGTNNLKVTPEGYLKCRACAIERSKRWSKANRDRVNELKRERRRQQRQAS